MNDPEELKLNGLLADEYPLLLPVAVIAFGVMVVLALGLYQPGRWWAATGVLAVTTTVGALAARGRNTMVNGSIQLSRRKDRVVIYSPFLTGPSTMEIPADGGHHPEVVRRDQVTSRGVTHYYRVEIAGQNIFTSKSTAKAAKVTKFLEDFLKAGEGEAGD